jgi:hypothetical protein
MNRPFYALGAALALFFTSIPSSEAVRLSNGKTYFDQVPTLVDAYTTQNGVNFSGASYYFRITMPQDAIEPLNKVKIQQFRALDDISFDFDQPEIGQAISMDQDKNISVVFNPPITAGESVSIRLRPVRNPRYGGVYLFGVTAFPQGEDPHGQFLGFGRLQFYNQDNFNFFFR